MKLDIISPEKILYRGEVELVNLPGMNGRFTILERHAPIIAALKQGNLIYQSGRQNISLYIEGGLVEEKNNVVTVCIE